MDDVKEKRYHKIGKESTNRGRREKSRFKKARMEFQTSIHLI